MKLFQEIFVNLLLKNLIVAQSIVSNAKTSLFNLLIGLSWLINQDKLTINMDKLD
jgi:hypothetical protein